MTALIGLVGVVVGVALGGGMQLIVGWRERKSAARRAARLLFGDQQLAKAVVHDLAYDAAWWSDDESAPIFDGWHRYREALAGAMDGDAFLTVDGAFHRVAELERLRQMGADADQLEQTAMKVYDQLDDAGGLLLAEGFSGRERERMQAEMDRDKQRLMEEIHEKMRELDESDEDGSSV